MKYVAPKCNSEYVETKDIITTSLVTVETNPENPEDVTVTTKPDAVLGI